MSHASLTSFTSRLVPLALAAVIFALNGCAGPVQRWIVDSRVHQGDTSLDRGNVRDAVESYRLALRIDPKDPRARAGFVSASADLARSLYANGDFDEALVQIEGGLKVDPSNVRLGGLKTTIEDAKLKREIVLSNYPTYKEAGLSIEKSYESLESTDKLILSSLKRFAYTYDTSDLTTAIKRSYALQLDVARNTNRLITYRQLVSSGIPEATQEAPATGGASLLPLP